jgi:Tol biopolymer transport system component
MQPRPATITSALAAALTLLAAAGALALHRETPLAIEITSASSTELGGQRWVANNQLLVFHSDADLLGNGNAVPQVFLFNQDERVTKYRLGLEQLTSGPGPNVNATVVKRGEVYAYQSLGDYLGYGRPGWQILIHRPARVAIGRGPVVQLTNGPGESFRPIINDQSKYIFFESTLDLLGLGLPPGTYLYRSEMSRVGGSICPSYPCPGNPGLELVAPVPAGEAAVSASGDRVAFISAGDVFGDGGANGFRQLYFRNYGNGEVRRLTGGNGHSRNPAISADGTRVVFESDANLTGTGGGRTQIYLVKPTATPPTVTQLTFGHDGDSTDPAITKAGDRIAFRSTASLLGAPTGGTRQIFFLDPAALQLWQLTAGTHDQGPPALQYSFVTFATRAGVAGGSGDGLRLVLINTFKVDAEPTVVVTATPVQTATPTRTATPDGAGTPTPMASGPPVPSPTTGGPAPAPSDLQGVKATVKCQRAITMTGARLAIDELRRLGKCAGTSFRCVQTREGERRERCLASAGSRCAKQLERAAADEAGAVRRIVTNCAWLGPGPLWDASGLGYGSVAAACGLEAGTDGIGAVAACLVGQYTCRAERLVERQQPRTKELLRGVGIAPAMLGALACLPEHPGDGGGLGDPGASGKALDRCAAEIGRSGTRLVAAIVSGLGNCLTRLYQCTQLKPGDQTCLDKAGTACRNRRARIAGERDKLAAAVAARCAGLDFATEVRPRAALNLEALDALPAGPVTTLSVYIETLGTEHTCLAEEMLLHGVPRAPELIALLDSAASFPSACAAP